MTVLEYIKTERLLNLELLAKRMWPTNKDAAAYLSRKINGARAWTAKDSDKAKSCLKELFREQLDRVDQLE